METKSLLPIILLVLFVLSLLFLLIYLLFLGPMFEKNKAKLQNEQKKIKQWAENDRFVSEIKRDGYRISKSLHSGMNHFGVDSVQNKVFLRNSHENRTADFQDIISYELCEDGESITSGGTENAIVGAALFGVAGAIVGSTMKKTTNVCNSMLLRITLKDIVNPSFIFSLIPKQGAVKNGVTYNDALYFAKEVCSTLAAIQSQ